MGAVPDGFVAYRGRSRFVEPWQPMFRGPGGTEAEIGLVLDEQHCNSRRIAHGGLIMSLADNAMAFACERGLPPNEAVSPLVTVHVDVDFLAPAALGQWLEFTASASGRSVRFARCEVTADGEPCARVSGIYRVLG